MITQSSAIEKANAREERFVEETRRISEIADKLLLQMITQSSATEKANARAERFAEETRRISEIADRLVL
jgi:hypothetical protein